MNYNELSFEEVKEIIESNEQSALVAEICKETPNYNVLTKIMLDAVAYAIENGEKIENPVLLSGDIGRIGAVCIQFPFLCFEDKYENVFEYALAFSSLCRNYFSIHDPSSPIIDLCSTLDRVANVQLRSERLVCVTNILLAKFERLVKNDAYTDIGISKQFLESLMGVGLDYPTK